MHSPEDCYDVAVLGSGLGGSSLAAILARQGLRTLLLEAQSHPRFSVGESVVAEFGARAELLARAFDVPELAHMRNFQRLARISAGSGPKRNFSFLHHTQGREQRPGDVCQFETMAPPLGPDSHILRAELDAYLTSVAVGYGADYRDGSPVESVERRGDVMALRAGGRGYTARFVVDGSGPGSCLARPLADPGLRADTRSLFTHMVGVGAIDALRGAGPRLKSSPDQGTLHHTFDGGWFWVIPFGNHRASLHDTCSVGLTLERSRFPDNELPAAQEFAEFAARFPTVAAQFEGARPIRSWVKTGRLQRRVERVTGEGWCLLPHTAGFVDPLFSGGMVLTLLGVQRIAQLLLQGFEQDDLAPARFASLDEDAAANAEIQDTLVHSAYLAFRSHALFHAWYRIWALGNFHAALGLTRELLAHAADRGHDLLAGAEAPLHRRVMGMGHPRLRALLDQGHAVLERVAAGELDASQGVDALFGLVEGLDWVPPQFHVADRGRAYLTSFTVAPMLRMVTWGKRHAPPDVREAYYDLSPVYFQELIRCFGREGAGGLSSFWRVFQHAHTSRGRA